MTRATTPRPPYTPAQTTPAYQLRYTWSGWPSRGAQFPPEPDAAFFESLGERWDADDGFRLLERWWTPDEVHLLTSARPDVAPQSIAGRTKGRLQHALRQRGTPTSFSRSFCLKSIGEATRESVEAYIDAQVAEEQFADPRFEETMSAFTTENPGVDLSEPVTTNHGRYYYGLHVVLVVAERYRIGSTDELGRLRDLSTAVASKKGHRLSRLSVMPDHLHLAVGAEPDQSPRQVALAYMNNLAYGLDTPALWQSSYYVGTFGEYDMGALRQNL